MPVFVRLISRPDFPNVHPIVRSIAEAIPMFLAPRTFLPINLPVFLKITLPAL